MCRYNYENVNICCNNILIIQPVASKILTDYLLQL